MKKSLFLVIAIVFLISCAKQEMGSDGSLASLDLTKATGSYSLVSSFGTNPGNLSMYKYVPLSMPSNAPVVVALHGCAQNASTYRTDTGWNELADRFKFYVIYAEQKSANNFSSCFNWFNYTADAKRGVGEALSIKQMVDYMKNNYSVNSSKVYVTGLSAGAAMTSVMLAAYPDVFAGGAIMAGVPYYCATSSYGGTSCMNGSYNYTPATWGGYVRTKSGLSGYTGPWPKVAVFHGSSDSVVKPMNMTEIMEQWTNVHGIDQTADFTETFRNNSHKVYKDSSGVAKVETWSITGMSHAITVDPGTGTDQGGSTNTYSKDYNVYSSYYAGKFWGLIQ